MSQMWANDIEAALFEFAHGRVEPLRAAGGQHHFRAGLGQAFGGFLAQPARGAGHDGDAPLQREQIVYVFHEGFCSILTRPDVSWLTIEEHF